MISKKLEIDDIDKQIMMLVQRDPNLTHTKIAAKINRSQPTIGARIKKLEKAGILQFQPGVDIKSLDDIFLAIVELNAKNPEKLMLMAKRCPNILNMFRAIGKSNIYVLLACSELNELYNIVDHLFRQNSNIDVVSMEVIIDIAKKFVIPINFLFEEYSLKKKYI